jgi:endonuclease/exonuclease/phosphatase family metal-dependent hydrolase
VHFFLILLTTLFLITGVQSLHGQNIIIDENYGDWEAISSFSAETSGDSDSGDADFLDFKIHSDSKFIYLYVEVDEEILIQQNQNITLLIDTDDNSQTGEVFEDIGYELMYNLGQRFGEVYLSGETSINSYDIGLVTSPTVSSSRFELVINRDAEVDGTPLFPSDEISLLLRTSTSGGDLVPDAQSDKTYELRNDLYQTPEYSIEKKSADEVRVMSYNVLRDNLFESSVVDNYRRIFQAVKPDIIGLEEVYDHSGSQAAELIGTFVQPEDSGQWYSGDVGNDNLLVSRYPVTDQTAISGNAAFLLDMGEREMLVLVAHPPCCGNDDGRQQEFDAMMAFVRDSQNGTGNGFELEENTPVVIVGDMNLVGLNRQVETLLTGDIANENNYGIDFNPDWDGTALEDSKPQNPELPTTFTWYSDGSSFSAGRLDYIVYSGSVLEKTNSFALHTLALPADTLQKYQLESDDTYRASDHLPIVADFNLKTPTSVEEQTGLIPGQVELKQNYPNPFNPTTRISFYLSSKTHVVLEIFDLNGRKISTLMDGVQSSGNHDVTWNAGDQSSGVYVYKLTTEFGELSKKMILVK